MSHGFIIIDHNAVEAEKTLETLNLFPQLNCMGVFKNDESLFSFLLKKKPTLVFVAHNALQLENAPLSFDSISRMHDYFFNFIYFIYLGPNTDLAFRAIQAGFSDYLVSPIQIHLLGTSLARFRNRVPTRSNQYLVIKSYSDYKFVKYSEILYLKADNNTTDIVLTGGKTIAAFHTLKHYQEHLPINFIRIHKSYIVHIEAVNRIHFSHSKCYLNNGEIIPISPNYRTSLDYIIEQLQV